MDTVTSTSSTAAATPNLGEAFQGGYFVGRILVAGETYAVIAAPKVEGDWSRTALLENGQTIEAGAAMSFNDGAGNTAAFAAAGSKFAQWALGHKIGEHADWYIPSRDELELVYRALKPTVEENYCGSGDNPSSMPPGYAYSPDSPAQCQIEAFHVGGTEALEEAAYWSSTRFAGDESCAWYQSVDDGDQYNDRRDDELRVRLVRRVKL